VYSEVLEMMSELSCAVVDERAIAYQGHVVIDYDMNRGFTQPLWLCIDTRRFIEYACRETGVLVEPEEPSDRH